MSSKRLVFVAVVLAAAALVLSARSGPGKPGADAPAKTRTPLVRLDLLQPAEATLAAERRNIFTAGPAQAEEEQEEVPAIPSGDQPDAGSVEAAPPAEGGLAVQYVGFVLKPKGIIGLVLVQNSPVAVAQGDVVQPGYTVTRLTRKEIEIAAPDGSKRVYALQGVQE